MSGPVVRTLALIFSVFLLTAATPPIPDVLKPYIKGDRFDPGDYKWMKGRFPDATPEEKAQDKQVRDWLKAPIWMPLPRRVQNFAGSALLIPN